jgi:hypothetical protein
MLNFRRDYLVRSVTEADPEVSPDMTKNKTSSLPERKTSLNDHQFFYGKETNEVRQFSISNNSRSSPHALKIIDFCKSL